MNRTFSFPALLAVLLIVFLVAGWLLPQWQFITAVALAKGFPVLGLLLLLRTGLVSFGQALYYCLGAYTTGAITQFFAIHDAILLVLAGTLVATVIGLILGALLSNYRGIFFAMLSLAFSMILYGLLVKSEALGSTDGFNVPAPSIFGFASSDGYPLYALTCVLSVVTIWLLKVYFGTTLGRLSTAIRDNEIRVEYMGTSARQAIYIKYVIAAALAGAGGSLAAMVVGHIDPDMAYWTTSGEFVFVTILSGIGNVIAPYLGSLLFEVIRSLAYQHSPNTWQLSLGAAMLLVIVFLPNGLWSLFRARRVGG